MCVIVRLYLCACTATHKAMDASALSPQFLQPEIVNLPSRTRVGFHFESSAAGFHQLQVYGGGLALPESHLVESRWLPYNRTDPYTTTLSTVDLAVSKRMPPSWEVVQWNGPKDCNPAYSDCSVFVPGRRGSCMHWNREISPSRVWVFGGSSGEPTSAWFYNDTWSWTLGMSPPIALPAASPPYSLRPPAVPLFLVILTHQPLAANAMYAMSVLADRYSLMILPILYAA